MIEATIFLYLGLVKAPLSGKCHKASLRPAQTFTGNRQKIKG